MVDQYHFVSENEVSNKTNWISDSVDRNVYKQRINLKSIRYYF